MRRGSPLMPMDLAYDFRILPPGEAASTAILVRDVEGPMLTASFTSPASKDFRTR